ncbi:hypothetical protein ACU9F8_000723 [Cronobacter sakazakii]
MHSENNELVKSGHELAKCLDNEPLLDIAKLLSKMATQLDVTTAALREKTKQCEKLAEENAELKNALEWLYEAVSMPDSGPIPDKYYSAVTNAAAVMHETPATDAFLREVRAQGVEMFAEKCSSKSKQAVSSDTRDGWWLCGEHASDFAAQIRSKSEAQS